MLHQRPNPVISFGAVVGIVGGVAATALGAWAAKGIIERKVTLAKPGPGGIPPRWLGELEGVLQQGQTVGDWISGPHEQPLPRSPVALPTAFNVFGLQGVEGPTQAQFPAMTQPDAPLWSRTREGRRVPLSYLFASRDGEVGFRVDQDLLLDRGIGFDVTAEATWADGTPAGAQQQIRELEIDLASRWADRAYAKALERVSQEGDAFDVPSATRDAFVRSVLQAAVPSFDWAGAPANLALSESYDTSVGMVWQGVSLLAQLAYQDHWVSTG